LLKVENKEARDFYIEEAIENNWSTRQLERQINSFYYQRLISSRDKHKLKVEAKKTKEEVLNDEFVKDPYILEFLELKKNTNYFEKDIEKALIDKLQDFLLELGKGFAFVERQQRISADNDNFYIDLVFYNYILKCFVLIDLKAGKLTHQDIGQMDMYVRMYEDLKRSENDNPTIGIILCSEKNDTVIKYSVLKENKQLFASKYMIYMPSEKELKKELEKERMLLNEEKKEK
jgi:predicted nuclease of restriction endonuclease-like (RecB) superfamily